MGWQPRNLATAVTDKKMPSPAANAAHIPQLLSGSQPRMMIGTAARDKSAVNATDDPSAAADAGTSPIFFHFRI